MTIPDEFRGAGYNKYFTHKKLLRDGFVYLFEVTHPHGARFYHVFRGTSYPDNPKNIYDINEATSLFKALTK